MKQFHFIAGLPRSGSTLLANVLNQHPDIYASSTSPLAQCVSQIVNTISNLPEVQSDLASKPGSQESYVRMIRGMIEGRYETYSEKVIVDKGRGWTLHRLLLDQIMPGSIVFVTVRDPRDVVASIERQHRQTAIFDSPIAKTIYEVADLLMRPDGMVGGPCHLIEDTLRRKLGGVVFLQYESLVANPLTELTRVFNSIGFNFVPDINSVEDSATDVDALYLNKFPHHNAVGKIKPTAHTWQDCFDEELGNLIISRYPLFSSTFHYK